MSKIARITFSIMSSTQSYYDVEAASLCRLRDRKKHLLSNVIEEVPLNFITKRIQAKQNRNKIHNNTVHTMQMLAAQPRSSVMKSLNQEIQRLSDSISLSEGLSSDDNH